MRNCFVPLCDKQCRNNPKRMMFLVPKTKEILDQWINILPKVREMKSHDKVCERHFRKEDIITTYDHIIQGQMFQMERGRARLKKKAVPCLNLPTNEEITSFRKSKSMKFYEKEIEILISNEFQAKSKSDTTKRDITKKPEKEQDKEIKHLIETNGVKILEQIQAQQLSFETATEETQEEFPMIVEDSSLKVMEIFNMLYDEIYEVVLPSTLWGVHRCPERTMIFFSYVDPKQMQTTKMISISDSGSVKLFVANKLVNEFNLDAEIISTDVLSNILSQANDMYIYPKATESEFCVVKTASETTLYNNCNDNV